MPPKRQTEQQTTFRLTAGDVAVLDEVQRQTGLLTRSDAIRYVIRQYALANEIPFEKKVRK